MAATREQADTWAPMLVATVGSVAYGLATEESDVDTLGMAVMPTEHLFRVHPPTERDLTYVGHDPDLTLHEVSKFVRLCLSANPSVTELLWMPDALYTYRTPLADELIGLRSCLLSRRKVITAYFGYAWAQFERLARKGTFANVPRTRIAKHARHIRRLVVQGEQLYRTGRMSVRVEDPQRYHDFGDLVASDQDSGIAAAREFIQTTRAALDDVISPLAEQPDIERVQLWLHVVRTLHLGRDAP